MQYTMTAGLLTATISIFRRSGTTSEDKNPTTVFIPLPRGVALSSVFLAQVFSLVIQADRVSDNSLLITVKMGSKRNYKSKVSY